MMENINYTKAMSIEQPDPAKEFPTFEDDVLMALQAEKTKAGEMELDSICEFPCGLYALGRYLKSMNESATAGFITDVAELKGMYDPDEQAKQIAKINSTYLGDAAPGAVKIPYENPDTARKKTGPVDEALYKSHIAPGSWPLKDGKALKGEGVAQFDAVEPLIFEYIRATHYSGFLESSEFKRYLRFLKIQQTPPGENDFNKFRTLGKGGFGIVYGCRTMHTGKMYAMKMCMKKHVKKGNAKFLCDNEHLALRKIDSPFCVNLKYAFQTDKALVLIIDLMMGGDLSFWLHFEKDKCAKEHTSYHGFEDAKAKYYTARAILGLQCLHDSGIVYRDLKPENILLGEDGRSRLSDMGLAVKITPKLKGTSGTPGYFAPEMLRKECYGHLVDWFSLGCQTYELLTGKGPFRGSKADKWGGHSELVKNITQATLEMEVEEFESPNFTPESIDFCKQLLNKDPTKRIGQTTQELFDHPWFKDLNWGEMASDKTPPPFEPGKGLNMKDADEIGEFKSLGKEVVLEDSDYPPEAWNYVSPKFFQSEVVWYLSWKDTQPAKPEKKKKKKSSSGGGSSFCVIS